MKNRLLLLPALLLCSQSLFSRDFKNFNPKNTLAFVENKGQIHDQAYRPRTDVMYGAMAGDMAFHLKRSGVSYQLQRVETYKEVKDRKTGQNIKETDKVTIYRVDLNWIGSNPQASAEPGEPLPGLSNYYFESCPQGALGVKSYKNVTLKDLYPNIDLHYYEKNGQLKHDYIVAPGGDYRQIRLKVEGAAIRRNAEGGLILLTPLGEIEESKPVVYQGGKILNSEWVVSGNEISFHIKGYDPSEQLVIDPLTRLWGTYIGGNDVDYFQGMCSDAAGNIYCAGSAASPLSIATAGAHQQIYSGMVDAILLKFDAAGNRIWGTYYGGTDGERGVSCCADQNGDIYMCGFTPSVQGTLIATPGSHQPAYGGGSLDGFLVKFNSNGIRQWGTYYGAGGDDSMESVSTDAAGNVYCAGTTSSTNSIATPGSHQPVSGGHIEAYVVKFSSSGVRQWGTYYGGANLDVGRVCATDGLGNIYLGGNSGGATGTIVATPASHQPAYSGSLDAFLAKFNSSGVRQWATYYGGVGIEQIHACSVDAFNNVYLSGETGSPTTTLIATPGCLQPAMGGGGTDAFLVKFDNNGSRLWGTYYGGSGGDINRSSTVDAAGNVIFAGSTGSTGSVMATANTYQQYDGGGGDAYLVSFNSGGSLLWASYYGGSGLDMGYCCTAGPGGAVYLGGYSATSSGTAIASPGSHQPNYGGALMDAFLVKIAECPALNPTVSATSSLCAGSQIVFVAGNTGTFVPDFYWTGPNNYTSALQNPVITNAGLNEQGTYTLTISNAAGCSASAAVNVSVVAAPVVTVNSGTICAGDSFTIVPGGALSYTISGGVDVVSPALTSAYAVSGTGPDGCISLSPAICSVSVLPVPVLTVTAARSTICAGESSTLVVTGASSYSWTNATTGSTIVVSPTTTTSYTVSGTDAVGCLSDPKAFTQVVSKCTGLPDNALFTDLPHMYPNPCTDQVWLSHVKDKQVIITNALGQIVSNSFCAEDRLTLRLDDFPKGFYTVTFQNPDHSLHHALKLIRQ